MDSCSQQNTHFIYKAVALLMLPFSFMMMASRLALAITFKIYGWANVKANNLFKKLRAFIQKMMSIVPYPINRIFGKKAITGQETGHRSKQQDEEQISKESALQEKSAKDQEIRTKMEQQIFNLTRQLSLRDGELLREKKANLQKLEELEKVQKLLNSQQEETKLKDNKISALEETKISLETQIDWLKLQMNEKSAMIPPLESKLQQKQGSDVQLDKPQKKNQNSHSDSEQPSKETQQISEQKRGASNESDD